MKTVSFTKKLQTIGTSIGIIVEQALLKKLNINKKNIGDYELKFTIERIEDSKLDELESSIDSFLQD